ncbi:MAG: PspC domain-containing protein [Abditibacteriota bacterium]|nr:PspC domain-containing protein [Abditibacteriota bacterium]MBP5094091.1 PspC domain-containing protein [Abditibacteriota bacterium]MBP5718635.1 PspC domain-containing protein [Abditibacteriota bacterium]MBP5737702.1 PspC domain-containing protein [Abditibacteriota bacterium]
MDRKLCKNVGNKKIAGVCSGMAEYFAIDVTIMRILWVIFALCSGVGIIAYIIAAIIMPES